MRSFERRSWKTWIAFNWQRILSSRGWTEDSLEGRKVFTAALSQTHYSTGEGSWENIPLTSLHAFISSSKNIFLGLRETVLLVRTSHQQIPSMHDCICPLRTNSLIIKMVCTGTPRVHSGWWMVQKYTQMDLATNIVLSHTYQQPSFDQHSNRISHA